MLFVTAPLVSSWWLALTLAQDPSAIRLAMRSSVAQQRASVRSQANSPIRKLRIRLDVVRDGPGSEPALVRRPECSPIPASQLEDMVTEAGQREGVSPSIIREVVRQESGGQPCAVSSKGAQGLMQLMPVTQARFGVQNPFDPTTSLAAGTKLLKLLIDRYRGNLKLALSAYNAGTEVVDRVGTVPNIPETQGYVAAILRRLAP